MYLYFDKKGTLKEIINDEALRQGNYNINKMYVYVDERPTYTSIDITYTLPSGSVVGPMNFNTFETDYIPFDAKRDLRFFKYNQQYRFCVIDLSQAMPTNDENVLGASALDEAGVVHANLAIMLSYSQLALGEVNFNVEMNSALEQGVVGPEEYLSLSNYYYLRLLINGDSPSFVPYTGAVADLNLGTDNELKFGSSYSIGVNNGDLRLLTGSGSIVLNPDEKVYCYNKNDDNEVATKGYISSELESALASYVPYNNASGNVDLGDNSLEATILTATNSMSTPHITIGTAGNIHDNSADIVIETDDGGDIILSPDTNCRVDIITKDYAAELDAHDLTANRNFSFPDKSGTVALTSDIIEIQNAVPYTGAVGNVDLGNNGITAKSFNLTDGFAAMTGTTLVRGIYHLVIYDSSAYIGGYMDLGLTVIDSIGPYLSDIHKYVKEFASSTEVEYQLTAASGLFGNYTITIYRKRIGTDSAFVNITSETFVHLYYKKIS